jgi:TolA-binding protein
MRLRRAVWLGLLVCLALSSCAYYNTYYLARKNYERGTDGLPYPVERPDPGQAQYFTKSIEFSRKLLGQYPTDKLVDDAYLLWARSLLGTDDPRQAIKLLEDFPTQFPQSPLQKDALFYLGVANRQARKYTPALRAFDEFLATADKNDDLRPYALLERSRTLTSLERHSEAAAAVAELIDRYPRFKLIDRARLARAEALLAKGAHEEARQAFRDLGTRANSDEERLRFLLREAESLEAGRRYDEELALLNDAIAHERPPIPADTSANRNVVQPAVAGSSGYGQLLVRIGTAQLMSGHLDKALDAYRRVALDYSRQPLAAEAQYRIGYAYETVGDDFEKARAEYQRVREHGAGGSFVDQANNRLSNLDRLAQFKSSTGDSAGKKAEAGFLLAEVYLFQLDKPERAVEEYRKIAQEFAGTPMAAKAMNAEAWVLSRKLERKNEADSLFWSVVHDYPKTAAQLAARDYLEMEGVSVPENLIQLPEPPVAVADTTALPPPQLAPPTDLTRIAPGPADSVVFGQSPLPFGGNLPPRTSMGPSTFRPGRTQGGPFASPAARDSAFPNPPPLLPPRDSTNVQPPQPGGVPPDTSKAPK